MFAILFGLVVTFPLSSISWLGDLWLLHPTHSLSCPHVILGFPLDLPLNFFFHLSSSLPNWRLNSFCILIDISWSSLVLLLAATVLARLALASSSLNSGVFHWVYFVLTWTDLTGQSLSSIFVNLFLNSSAASFISSSSSISDQFTLPSSSLNSLSEYLTNTRFLIILGFSM